MRILVTGSRKFRYRKIVALALADTARGHADVTVVHGACPSGADAMAHAEARDQGFHVDPHPADWDRHGKAAGFIRNQEMVDAGADICLAFYQAGAANKGTADCVKKARRAGIQVLTYGPYGQE
jgi:hypothetical protein